MEIIGIIALVVVVVLVDMALGRASSALFKKRKPNDEKEPD